MEQDSTSGYLSPDEFLEQLNKLPATDVSRVMNVAMAKYVNGTGMEFGDLLQESIARILAGSRRVPKNVPMVAFLIQTIRSISSTERNKDDVALVDSLEDRIDELSTIPSHAPSPEQIIVEAQKSQYHRNVLDQLNAAFNDDPHAQAIFQGRMERLSSSEIRENSSMSSHEYDAARKRVDRTLLRIKAQGD